MTKAITFINPDARRKAALTEHGLVLSKLSPKNRSERQIWPAINGDSDTLQRIAEAWLYHGTPFSDHNVRSEYEAYCDERKAIYGK